MRLQPKQHAGHKVTLWRASARMYDSKLIGIHWERVSVDRPPIPRGFWLSKSFNIEKDGIVWLPGNTYRKQK